MPKSKPKQTELSTQDLPEIPAVQDMITWNKEKVLRWIRQRDRNILEEEEEVDNFKEQNINGRAFLASNVEFFQRNCGLSSGVSLALQVLVNEVKEGKLSNQTAGSKRKEDEIDAPEPPNSPKRNRQEDPSSELATRASERWKRIREMITDINGSSDQHSNSVEPANPLSGAVDQLSSPAIQIKLPFPFIGGSIPERFSYDGDHDYWDYMGREKFTELLDAIKVLETTGWRGYMFYGTIGYGKSHLLAALACYLISAGKRVIYIPDCRECAWNPVPYFQAAILLAWGAPDDSDIRKEIITLNTMEAISGFFGGQSNIFFLVDQMNVLERDPSGTDGLSDAEKRKMYKWIRKCVAPHKYIFSASANNQNRGWTDGKQTGARQLLVYGGFSAAEMQQWWDRNEKLIPENYTKDEVERFKSKVEDLTGSIPLLLRECVVNEKIDLSADTLKNVAKQVRTFMKRLKLDVNTTPEKWDTHCEYVRACISGQAVMDDTPSNLIDNRYFFAEAPDLIGKYACGIAREAAARQLRRYKVDKFGDTDFLMALNDYIDNPSVTGFFIEQAILSSIASRGLQISQGISNKMDTVMFSGRIPKFNTTKGDPVLYCPITFNYRGIDGIIVRFTEGKCFMFPLQIHSDSEEVFFREWSMWTNKLDGFEVVPVFIWITKEDSEISTVDAEYRSTKSETRLIHPSYNRQKVPLGEVNLDIWERYQRALGRLQENLKSWAGAEDEHLRDSQAPLDASETEKVGGGKGGGKSSDRTTGGEEQRESEEPEGAEEQARSGGPSATAGPSVQEARESGGKGGRREDYMKKKVPELKKLLKNRSKPWTGTKSQLVDRLLEDC